MKKENRKYILGDSDLGLKISNAKRCSYEFYTEEGMSTTILRLGELTAILMTNEGRDYACLEVIEWNDYTTADMISVTTVNNISARNEEFWSMIPNRQAGWLDIEDPDEE